MHPLNANEVQGNEIQDHEISLNDNNAAASLQAALPELTINEQPDILTPLAPDQTGLLLKALLTAAPRPLSEIQAELIFSDGQLIWHSMQNGCEQYKGVSVESVQAAFGELHQDSGWLPTGIVRTGRGSLGEWWVQFIPPQTHSLLFELASQAAPERLSVPLPGLVLFGYGLNYYLWAVKGDTFDEHQPVFTAPLPNVASENGQICFGSANPLPVAGLKSVGTVWQLFLDAPFSDHRITNKCVSYPGDVRELLLKLSQSKAKHFPADELAGGGLSLDYAINTLLKGRAGQ